MNNVLEFPDSRRTEADAADWLILLDRDIPPTIEERQQLKDWLDTSPTHREAMSKVAELWGQLNVLTKLAVDLDSPQVEHPLSRLKFAQLFSGWGVAAMATAASLVLALAVVMPVLDFGFNTDSTNGYYATAVGSQRQESLDDGSTILLNTNSHVEVAYDGQYRNIYLLQGEAHFTVEEDPEKPFRVFAGGGLVNAVGTAFTVYLQGDDVDVLVTEGTVSLASTVSQANADSGQFGEDVQENDLDDLGLLEAGQIATIKTRVDGRSNRVGQLDDLQSLGFERVSDRLSWRQGLLTFTGEPMEKVVQQIGRYTTVQLDLADDIKSMRVGGKFPVGDTDTMLTALESNFGLKITWLSHSHVVISRNES